MRMVGRFMRLNITALALQKRGGREASGVSRTVWACTLRQNVTFGAYFCCTRTPVHVPFRNVVPHSATYVICGITC